jgi:hypothetical protein
MKNQMFVSGVTAQALRLRTITVGCLVACGVAAAVLPMSASAASGQFTYVTGTVFIERNGVRLNAIRGTEVNPGDIIVADADGMAQLAMIDQAKLSLRSNSRLRIESYQQKVGDQDGAVLSLLRGTLRTFTGLLTSANREKYQMKTRVATVGIRGSGNILSHEEEGDKPVTINHTIEGSHVITSLAGNFAPVVTFPNDTIKVEFGKPPEKIPTPPAILTASNTMIISKDGQKAAADVPPAPPLPTVATGNPPSGTGGGSTGNGTSGNTPLNLNIVPQVVVTPDPSGLRDIVLAGASTTYSGQALPGGITLESGNLRGFTSAGGVAATITGGTIAEARTIDIGSGSSVTFGRWNSPANVNFAGIGSFTGPAATTHFAYGGSGYPAYLSDVLTGTVSYERVGATSPTDQAGSTGSITSTLLSVNFTARLLNATIALSMPIAGALPATNYTLQAANVPFTLNSFFAITGFGLTVTNNTTGQNSGSNFNLNGAIEGSFVGAALNGVILGYAIQDGSASNSRRDVSGVVVFQGPAQNTNAPFQTGLISDPTNSLQRSQYSQTYATINRPAEVTIDAAGRATTFRGPFARADGSIDGNSRYSVGTAQVVDAGVDATTGLSWGRWSGGSAVVGGVDTSLAGRSLHYIFSAPQTGPTTLPLTGTAVYEVAGATRPTDLRGNVGTMNTATLNANFSARTVDASVNVTIANQTWNASATGMPIYRDMTFAANTGGSPGGGLPPPTQLNITCTPNCGAGFTGSFDGFFTGTNGQGAGLMYNLNRNINGAVAFRRRQ